MIEPSQVEALKQLGGQAKDFLRAKISPTQADKVNEHVRNHVADLPLMARDGHFLFSGTVTDDEARTTPWETIGGSAEYGFTTATFRQFSPKKDEAAPNFKSVLGGGLELVDRVTTTGDMTALAQELDSLGYDLRGVPPSKVHLSVLPGSKRLSTVSSQEWWFKNPETGRMSSVVLAYEPETKADDDYRTVQANPRRIYVADAIINPVDIKQDRIYTQKPKM